MSDIDTRPASALTDEELAQRQAEDMDITLARVNASLPNVILQPLDGFAPPGVYRIHSIKSGTKQ